jgi:hypothetical protein
LTGVELITGKDISSSVGGTPQSGRSDGEPLALVAALAAAGGLAAALVSGRVALQTGAAAGITAFVFLLLTRFSIDGRIKAPATLGSGSGSATPIPTGVTFTATYEIGYWLALALSAIAAGLYIYLLNADSRMEPGAEWPASTASEPRAHDGGVGRPALRPPPQRLPRDRYYVPVNVTADANANPNVRYFYGDGRSSEAALGEALEFIKSLPGDGKVVVEAVWLDRNRTELGIANGPAGERFRRSWRSATDAAEDLFLPDSEALVHASTSIGSAGAETSAVPTAKSDAGAVGEPATKICPDCAETVLAAARICRFCKHEFQPIERA